MSTVKPIVSIILPTYNGTKYLRQSIESILGQTFEDFELIIVDDCSTDNTQEVVASFSDPRIKYIRNQKNQRLPRSLNIGFAAAKGDYLTWTSDDNYFAPTAIEEMAAYLTINQADFVYCDFYYIYVTEQGRVKVRNLQDAADSLKYEDCIGACFMYTRKVYGTVGDYDTDMEFVEDYDYWVRVSLHFPLGHIKKPLYHYRYHELSISGTKTAEIQIMEFLLKLKYNLLDAQQVNWFLRGLKLKTLKNPTVIDKIKNRLLYKARIERLLKDFMDKKVACSPTRYKLSTILYDKKHFVFLRKFDPGWDWGGAEQLIIDALERINYDRCQISLIVPAGSKGVFEKRLTEQSKRVFVKEMPFSLRTNAWKRFHLMFGLLSDLRPHTIIFIQGWYADFRAAEFLAAWLTARGNVYAHENSCPPLPPEKTSRTYAGGIQGLGLWWHLQKFYVGIKTVFCKTILTVSADVGDQLVRLWRYPKSKMTVVHHGTNSKHFFPSPDIRRSMRAAWNIDEGAVIIIVTARLAQEKRIERVIDAFDKTAQGRGDAFLFIAGQGPMEQGLKDLAQKKFSSANIRFLGHVDNVADILRMSDAYICSSDIEGLGIALLESMATGLVCIATKCSGPVEIIENGKNGFLVDRDTDAIATSLSKFFGLSSDEKRAIGASARNTIIERFDLDRNTKKMLEVLNIPSK